MINFKVGTVIQLMYSGENTYKIINIFDKCYELEVIDFYYPEGIGNGVTMFSLGETTLIPSSMSYLFKLI